MSGYGGSVCTTSCATATTRLTIIFRLLTGSLGGRVGIDGGTGGTKALPERYNVPFADGSPRVYAEAVKEDDVVKRRSVWIEGRLTDGNEEKRKEEMKDRPAYFYLGLSLWCIHSE